MPKMKTHQGLKKRVKITARGKVRFHKSFAGHLMSGKPSGRRRDLRKKSTIANKAVAARVRRALLI